MKRIDDQVRLPLGVAFEVVLSGIRIRFGRSLVTITGVVLGIAFLMSVLTGQLVNRGVGAEAELRAEVDRMLSFMTAEVGPLKHRIVEVRQMGSLDDPERRLIRRLAAESGSVLAWRGANDAESVLIAALGAGVRRLNADDGPGDADLVCVLGGTQSPAALGPLPAHARVGFTRIAAGQDGMPADSFSMVRQVREDEAQRRASDARQARFRNLWVIGISLLVTVIGITNAMLMSVTERFREIGTMKCLGALSVFVREIFFIESAMVGLVGSVAGGLLGAAFSIAAYSATYGYGLVLGALPVAWLGLYFGAAVAIGVTLSVLAAIYPAVFAARMVPAHALRSNI